MVPHPFPDAKIIRPDVSDESPTTLRYIDHALLNDFNLLDRFGTMPDKQNDPTEAEARRERVRWIKLVHSTWNKSLANSECGPVLRLFEDLGQTVMTGPLFDAIRHAVHMEDAIQRLVGRFDLGLDDVAILRDIIQRTIRKQ